jgi:hypothetical protein
MSTDKPVFQTKYTLPMRQRSVTVPPKHNSPQMSDYMLLQPSVESQLNTCVNASMAANSNGGIETGALL